VDASGDLIKAGGKLYAGGRNVVSAVDFSKAEKLALHKEAKISWQTYIEGTAARLIAADDKLFVVTLEGGIYAFGGEEVEPKIYPDDIEKTNITANVSAKAKFILNTTGVKEGYCLAYGLETGNLVEALARNSNLRIIAVEPDPIKVDTLRRRFDAMGLYGKSITVQVGDVFNFEAPPYLASLTVFENFANVGYKAEQTDSLPYQKIYHSLRPYGGVACLPVSGDEISNITQQIQKIDLPKAKVRQVEPTANLLQGLEHAVTSLQESVNDTNFLQEVEIAANLLQSKG
jgi:hypothetical protein